MHIEIAHKLAFPSKCMESGIIAVIIFDLNTDVMASKFVNYMTRSISNIGLSLVRYYVLLALLKNRRKLIKQLLL